MSRTTQKQLDEQLFCLNAKTNREYKVRPTNGYYCLDIVSERGAVRETVYIADTKTQMKDFIYALWIHFIPLEQEPSEPWEIKAKAERALEHGC